MSLLTIIAGFISGLVGSLGLGGGGILLMYFSLFTDIAPQKAGGINLLAFLPVGTVAVITYTFKNMIKWKTVLNVILGGIIGVGVGVMLNSMIDTFYLSKIFAAGLIVFGLTQVIPFKVLKEFFKTRHSSPTENDTL